MKKSTQFHFIFLKRILILGILIFALFIQTKATTIDSLKKVFSIKTNSTEKALISGQIISEYESNYDSALFYATNYIEYWKKQKNKFGIAYNYHCMGTVAQENSKYDEAKDLFNNAITIYEEIGNDSLKAKAYMRLGFVYYSRADYETAIKTYHSALSISEKINNINITSWAYNLLGLAFRSKPVPDYKKALEYYFKALEIDRNNKNGRGIGLLLLRIGSVYTATDDYEQSAYYLSQALRLADSLKILVVKKWTLEAMAGLYKKKKDYALAIAIEQTGLKMSKNVGEKPGIIISYMNIADNYKYLKNYKLAEMYIDSSIKVSLDSKVYQTLSNEYLIKSVIYEGKGEIGKAFEFYKKSIQIKDSLFSLQNSSNINDLETKYQTQKKEQSIQLLNKQKESDERVKNIFVIALSISAALICLIIYFLFNLSRSKRIIAIQKLETENQKDLVVEKQKEIIESITYAKRLQEAILPSREFIDTHLPHNFIIYQSKDLVAGDFYWAEKIKETFYIAAADSTGHGVPGALVSVVCSNALNRSIKEFLLTDPGEILNKTRELVIETFEKSSSEVKDGMDISLLSIKVIDKDTKEIKWSGANNPLLYIHNNQLIEIKGDKQPIGKTEYPKPFTTHKIEYKKSTNFYLFTDGIADQFGGPKGKKFKYKQLKDILLKNNRLSVKEQSEIITTSFTNWKGNLEQVDDVCIVGLQI